MYSFHNTFLILLTMAAIVSAVSSSDSDANSDFEGKSLVAMGTLLDSPLLKLLGRAFERLEKDVLWDIDNKTSFVLGQVNKNYSSLEQRLVLERKELTDIIGRTERLEKDVLKIDNKTTLVLGQVNKDTSSLEQRLVSERRELIDIICQLHPCTEWEAWTACSAKVKHTFGAQTRSRTCDVKAGKLCSSIGHEQKETDNRICEGTSKPKTKRMCSGNYTLTTNEYCISVHTEYKNWTSAQAVCKKEGGYLMNIDSQLKALDVNSTLTKLSLTYFHLWIDGTRTLPGGEWRYEYGPHDTVYSNWANGEPQWDGDCRLYDLSSSIWNWWGRQYVVNTTMCPKPEGSQYHCIECIRRTCDDCGVDKSPIFTDIVHTDMALLQ